MEDVLDGDVAATGSRTADFDSLVAAMSPRLLGTAYLLTGERRAAEDLLQDTFIRVWRHWSRVHAADDPQAYIRRVLVTTSASRWRSAARRLRSERLVAEPPERVAVEQPGRDDELWGHVRRLPPRQRAVMVLTYYEDRGDEAIAGVLGCTVGTVKSQRAKALRTLRARIEEKAR